MPDKKIRELEQKYNCTIPDKRKRIWNIQLELLDIFDELCRKHDLTYFFFAGSLLGAVRHQGFIPWDDDIDVVMPRKDYEKLSRAEFKEIRAPYFLLTKDTVEDGVYACIKLMKENTTFIEKNGVFLNAASSHQGICIDIVPLDGFPLKRSVRIKQFLKQKIYFHLANQLVFNNRPPSSFKQYLVKLFGPFSKRYCRKKGRSRCIQQFEKQRMAASWDESEWIIDSGHNNVFPKALFESITYLDFEGRKVPAPANYDQVLKKLYGNYWELPEPKFRLITDHEAMGYIVDPDISYSDTLEILRNQKRAFAKEQNAIVHRYCDRFFPNRNE